MDDLRSVTLQLYSKEVRHNSSKVVIVKLTQAAQPRENPTAGSTYKSASPTTPPTLGLTHSIQKKNGYEAKYTDINAIISPTDTHKQYTTVPMML